MLGLIVLLVLLSLGIYALYRNDENEKKAAYLAMCSDFNNRITVAMRSRLHTVPAGLHIDEAEIAKLGLALIGKNIQFHDTRDAEIESILNLYYEGEYLFLRIMAGDPLKSKKALKFDKYIQWFKEAWLLSECDFLIKDNEKLRVNVEREILLTLFEGMGGQEKKCKIEYFENFHMQYEVFFTMLRFGKERLNINSLPPDDYRTHEGLRTVLLNPDRPFGDRASSYEFVFWTALCGVIDS